MGNRLVCTEQRPYDENNPEHKKHKWQHPNSESIGVQESGWPSGDIQRYKCRVCGLEFEVELPQ